MNDDGKERHYSAPSFQEILQQRARARAQWLASLRKAADKRR